MRTCVITLLLLMVSACGKLDCPSKFTGNECGAPYGPMCLSIDEYTAAGWNTCDDAKACGIVLIDHAYPCNPNSPLKP